MTSLEYKGYALTWQHTTQYTLDQAIERIKSDTWRYNHEYRYRAYFDDDVHVWADNSKEWSEIIEKFEQSQTDNTPDPVNSPSHYQVQNGKELKDVMNDLLTHSEKVGAKKYNIIKYTTRYKGKNGKQDLEKAIKEIKMLIEIEYPENN